MKLLQSGLCIIMFATHPVLAQQPAQNDPVVIDAANGSTHHEVQAALDAHPAGTTFLLRGDFVFSEHVHIEKSGTRILGDLVDVNDNSKPDQGDGWNTTITAIPNTFGISEGFLLMPKDELGSNGFAVSDVEISGIRFSGINFPVAVLYFPHPDQPGCRTEPLPYQLDDLVLERNWLEGGALFIYRSVARATIDNNLFTAYLGNHLSAHAIEMRGATISECGLPFGIEVQGQDRLTISNNAFTDGRDVSVGFQRDLKFTGNVMTGVYPYGNGSNKLWLSQASGATVSGNLFQGGPNDSGVLFWTRSNWRNSSDITSDAVDFLDNTFVDSAIGIFIQGGTDHTTIKDNRFVRSGTYGPAGAIGVLVSDIAPIADTIVVQPSKNVTIKDNYLSGSGVAGVVLNGQTTGVSVKNNEFDNPYAAFGDVALAEQDVLFGWGDILCPAYGNKVISDLPLTALVADGYSTRCEGSAPNKLLGDGIIDISP